MPSESAILATEHRLWAETSGSEALPAPTASDTARALSETLAAGEIDDHRDAVRAYAAERDGVTLTEDGSILTLSLSDGEVLIELDEQQRIGRLAFSMNADDLPRRGFWARLFGR